MSLLKTGIIGLGVGEGFAEITAAEVFKTMTVCFTAEESLNAGQAVAVKPILERML